jgi:hypothetical protein
MVRKRILLGDECITIVHNKKRGCAVGEQCAAEFELMRSKMRKRICCVSFNHPVTKGETALLLLLLALLTSLSSSKSRLKKHIKNLYIHKRLLSVRLFRLSLASINNF